MVRAAGGGSWYRREKESSDKPDDNRIPVIRRCVIQCDLEAK
jgi:hypothetical protein